MRKFKGRSLELAGLVLLNTFVELFYVNRNHYLRVTAKLIFRGTIHNPAMATAQTKTMRAARYYGPNEIKIEDIPIPPPPLPHEITISPLWSGICGTDLHEYICGPLAIRPPSNPHPLTHGHLPVSLGHEFCGTIMVIPEGYDGPLKLGMEVMVDPRLNCGKCHACRSGNEHICEKWGFLGLSGGGGGGSGFSELVNVAQSMCHVLPENVDVNDAVLIEPLAVGRHAISVSGIDDQRWRDLSVLVLGGGPVGLAVLYNLRAVGAGTVFVSEPTNKRQELVVGLGLAHTQNVLNPLIANVSDETRQKTGGLGIDIVFDCSGVPPGMSAGVDSLKIKGIYVNVAGWEQPVS